MPSKFERERATLRRNLARLYRRATADDKLIGAAWYPTAHRLMIRFSELYDVSIATAACVTAAVSPQCNWTRNTAVAEDILARRAVGYGALPKNVEKAKRILNDRAHSTLAYFPYGPKVASFAENLSGNQSIVTVDTHAIQAALGDPESTVTLKWNNYRIFAECYAHNAARLKMHACDYQSIIWHVWKRLHPTEEKKRIRQQWFVTAELEE